MRAAGRVHLVSLPPPLDHAHAGLMEEGEPCSSAESSASQPLRVSRANPGKIR